MTPHEFKTIRVVLGLTQRELAHLLGYRHKIRISEYERTTNPVPVPQHIAALMERLHRNGGRLPPGRKIRVWTHQHASRYDATGKLRA